MEFAPLERLGQTELAKRTLVKCYQFYEAHRSSRSVIKLLAAQNGTSTDPLSLEKILKEGPASFIENRIRALSMRLHDISRGEQPESETLIQEGSHTHIQSSDSTEGSLKSTTSDETESLANAWDFPEPSTYKFRWTHIPANNMRWVEKLLVSIEREVEDFRKEREEKRDTPSANAIQLDEGDGIGNKVAEWLSGMVDNPLAYPAGPILVRGAQKIQNEETSTLGILKKAFEDPTKLKKVIIEANPNGEAGKVDVDDTREQTAMLRAVNEIGPGTQPIQIWEKMKDAAMAPRIGPSLTGTLLKPTNWNFKQKVPIHKKLHGHFMLPGVEFFVPGLRNNSSSGSTIAHDSTLIQDCKNGQESNVLQQSKNEVLQLFLYVSPLVYSQNCAQMLIINSSLIFTGIHLVLPNIGGTLLIRR